MAPIRLRHPTGVATIQVPFDDSQYTVQDLQQEIYAASQILPSRQQLKTGYPPKSLALVPELPVSSLGIKGGDQLIVGEGAEPASRVNPKPVTSPNVERRPLTSAPIASSAAPAQRSVRTAPPPSASSDGPVHVPIDGSVLIHRVVPDDNSCLFTSTKAQKMRQIVADGIRKDPETYNEAILGMPPSKYIETITKPSTWGGAIELTILAAHYRTEICSIDVETGRIDQFTAGPDSGVGGMRCIVIYSGIHYDAATLAPTLDAPSDWHQTQFPIVSTDTSDSILVAGKKLADTLRSQKAFTNTSTFDLKCEDCGQGLKGEKGARAHAEQTGHVRFGEY
ncbi:OTU-domain-containing protein [Gymnopus androsaceus JB14]|uniref:Ubiquitin thioesterase OTU n=1 Tax=Gymnopus androsaceus JB14 TaxID=1447944 RepID=A0A6A4IKX6_9AGAR|nr:OTU-domain-containing protein [Gymnopus androsaceus JB14]